MIFDCLLFDISMPGMDGVELCRCVRQFPQYRQTPVIMLTAMRDMTHMGDAYRAGATDYVTKPFDIEELGLRLHAAQEAIRLQQEMVPARRHGTRYTLNAVRSKGFELSDEVPVEGLECLVDYTVLSNYLNSSAGKSPG